MRHWESQNEQEESGRNEAHSPDPQDRLVRKDLTGSTGQEGGPWSKLIRVN